MRNGISPWLCIGANHLDIPDIHDLFCVSTTWGVLASSGIVRQRATHRVPPTAQDKSLPAHVREPKGIVNVTGTPRRKNRPLARRFFSSEFGKLSGLSTRSANPGREHLEVLLLALDGLAQPTPTPLGGLLVVSGPLHLLGEPFLLTKLLETAEHLLDGFVGPGLHFDHAALDLFSCNKLNVANTSIFWVTYGTFTRLPVGLPQRTALHCSKPPGGDKALSTGFARKSLWLGGLERVLRRQDRVEITGTHSLSC